MTTWEKIEQFELWFEKLSYKMWIVMMIILTILSIVALGK